MDIDFLRTFLEVNKTRHFAKAASSLFVSQSTISSRIRMLEASLGIKVFTRDRNDIQLTTAGQKLLPQAEKIVNQWDETKRDISKGDETALNLSVGSLSSLWDILLQDWLSKLRSAIPDLMFKGESLSSDSLIKSILTRTHDVGLMFEPPTLRELSCTPIKEIDIVLISNNKNQSVHEAISRDYILVDWGLSFWAEHSRWFPDVKFPRLYLDLGRWAVDYLLTNGGSAYLAKSMVKDHLKNKTLFAIKDAPVLKRTAFAVYLQKSKNIELIEECLQYLIEK